MTASMTFPFRPIAKERPRAPKYGGASYTPPRTKRFEKMVREEWSLRSGVFTSGPVEVEIYLRHDSFDVIVAPSHWGDKSALRGDVDNYVKAILDGLNGLAFEDDRLVRKLLVTK
jgi:crossover junction endodeoxyribonuclease RusA